MSCSVDIEFRLATVKLEFHLLGIAGLALARSSILRLGRAHYSPLPSTENDAFHAGHVQEGGEEI